MFPNHWSCLLILVIQKDCFAKGFTGCGKWTGFTHKRILDGGEPTGEHELPWLVSLQGRSDDLELDDGVDFRDWTHLCGGSILSRRLVLTAVHCYNLYKLAKDRNKAFEFSVFNGGNSLKAMAESGNRILIELVNDEPKFILHEKYDYTHMSGWALYDVALVRLAEDLPIDDTANPIAVNAICLPKEDRMKGKLVVAGWGSIDRWQMKMPDLMGKARFDRKGQDELRFFTRGGPLRGDSGGPLMEFRNSCAALIGVVSFGMIDKEKGEKVTRDDIVTYYPKTYPLLDWIRQHTHLEI